MKIAQVSPLYESVPPKSYGGTERVVSYLTEELVRLGHDVTLFASGDSVTQAVLRSTCSEALRLRKKCDDALTYHILMIEKVFQSAEDFDIIHGHIDYLTFPLARRTKTKCLTTLHGRLDLIDLVSIFQEFDEMPLVSISNAQRKPLPWVRWIGTVYHGLPKDLYQFHAQPGNYLAYLGRISPEKRVDHAIEIAKRVGMKLKIAAKVDKVDQVYFDTVIKPLLNNSLIEFVGEIKQEEKNDFLGNAFAVLFPIDWPEPFGLVMIEAMACGTPVIACRRGSVPEVMEEGVTGFVCRTVNEAVRSVKKISTIDRSLCRKVFDERFTSQRMAEDYLALYEQLLQEQSFSTNGRKLCQKSYNTKINITS